MKFKRSLFIFLLVVLVVTGVRINFWFKTKIKKIENVLVSSVSYAKSNNDDLRTQEVVFSEFKLMPKKIEMSVQKEKTALFLSDLAAKNNKIIKERQFKIAVLGDSMVETMGQDLPYLEVALKNFYSHYNFSLLNYGVGATTIEEGIQRLTNEYKYQERKIPALISQQPDVVIIESFAYNPFGGENELDRHWSALKRAVEILKQQSKSKIIILATIAPNKDLFGSGPAGVNWNTQQAWQHAARIQQYLENTLRFARLENLPLVDAYTPSLVGGEGNLEYINPSDHIHPSEKGKQFIAYLIAKKLKDLAWLE